LIWEPQNNLTLRAAYLESIARPKRMERTIEPTQVAGFNQLIDDPEGSEIKHFGIGLDAKLRHNIWIGAEFNRRDLQIPLAYGAYRDSADEKRSTAYLYWTATDRLGLQFSYEKEDLERTLVPPQELTTQRTPIGFTYHWPMGLYLQALGTYVDQEIHRSGIVEQENFWNIDTALGYRFPKRYGKFEIIVKNLLDEEFRYFDLSYYSPELQMPQFQPERQLFARITLNF
jgi:hypothetical protein